MFELLHPILVKQRMIPHFPVAGERAIMLEEEDLVLAGVNKCRPIETDLIVITDQRNELLEISEPHFLVQQLLHDRFYFSQNLSLNST